MVTKVDDTGNCGKRGVLLIAIQRKIPSHSSHVYKRATTERGEESENARKNIVTHSNHAMLS